MYGSVLMSAVCVCRSRHRGVDAARRRNDYCCQWAEQSHYGREMSQQKDNKGSPRIAALLPPQGEGQIFGGRGEGHTCDLCGVPIESSQIEYEVEWRDDAGPRRSHFHLGCYERVRSDQRE